MSAKTYITLPGQENQVDLLRWQTWLPTLAQLWATLRFQLDDALDPHERKRVTVTMRQGLGLVVVLGLVAGLIPMIANLWLAVPMGAAVPLAQLSNVAAETLRAFTGSVPLDIAAHTVQTMAGLEPRMPGFFAALLSAMGIWLNWPLTWLTLWIVYGAFVMGLVRIMGANNTLEEYFAATSFAAVPLTLIGLAPLPWLGPLAAIIGMALAFVLYVQIVRYVALHDIGRTLIAVLAPIAVVVFVPGGHGADHLFLDPLGQGIRSQRSRADTWCVLRDRGWCMSRNT